MHVNWSYNSPFSFRLTRLHLWSESESKPKAMVLPDVPGRFGSWYPEDSEEDDSDSSSRLIMLDGWDSKTWPVLMRHD
jgi:hypothetical protein